MNFYELNGNIVLNNPSGTLIHLHPIEKERYNQLIEENINPIPKESVLNEFVLKQVVLGKQQATGKGTDFENLVAHHKELICQLLGIDIQKVKIYRNVQLNTITGTRQIDLLIEQPDENKPFIIVDAKARKNNQAINENVFANIFNPSSGNPFVDKVIYIHSQGFSDTVSKEGLNSECYVFITFSKEQELLLITLNSVSEQLKLYDNNFQEYVDEHYNCLFDPDMSLLKTLALEEDRDSTQISLYYGYNKNTKKYLILYSIKIESTLTHLMVNYNGQILIEEGYDILKFLNLDPNNFDIDFEYPYDSINYSDLCYEDIIEIDNSEELLSKNLSEEEFYSRYQISDKSSDIKKYTSTELENKYPLFFNYELEKRLIKNSYIKELFLLHGINSNSNPESTTLEFIINSKKIKTTISDYQIRIALEYENPNKIPLETTISSKEYLKWFVTLDNFINAYK